MILISSIVFVTGCGNAIPELTEEQQELVVEYAVGTLLKYDKNHEKRLMKIEELEAVEAQRVALQEAKIKKQNSVAEEKTDENNAENLSDATVIDNTQEVKQVYSSVEDILHLEQLVFEYAGVEVVDEYPNTNQEQELFFVMNATEGKKLLIVKFNVKNVSGVDTELNMNQIGAKFKIVADGEEKNALTTMLLNDLAYYQGTIAAGESKELVLVSEVNREKEQGINSLELIVKNVDESTTISLK